MKKLLLITMLCLPFVVNAQFYNLGVLAGGGLGGIKGKGLNVKSGLNPELGFMFKYNFLEKVSIRTFLNLEFHKFTLSDGKQVETDKNTSVKKIIVAPDYLIKSTSFTQHIDVTYTAIENKLDFSGGVFWAINFVGNGDIGIDEGLRTYYNATDSEILNESDYNASNMDENYTKLYASDQIRRSLKNSPLNAGTYFAVTGGTEKIKVMLRYDIGLINFYSKHSTTNKIKEKYLKIGLIYIFR